MFARPGLPRFEYVRAETCEQVVGRLARSPGDVRLLMGGTDLFPRLRDGSLAPRVVVDVKYLPGAREMSWNAGSGLTVGSAVTLNALAARGEVLARYPILAQAAGSVASYQVRNRATFGGNLCNASPAADTAPAALVLEARIVLCGPGSVREVPAGEFFLGPGKTAMGPGEFMTAIRLPVAPPHASGQDLKLGRAKAGDLAIAGVAVFGFPDAAARGGFRFRIALASVAPVPLRAREAEELLASEVPGAGVFALAAGKAAEAARPIDDVRAGAAYRRAMVRVLTLRGLRAVWQQLGGGET